LDEAISDFTKAIATDPAYALAYLDRGIALELKGRMAEADEDFHRSLEIKPSLKQLLEALRREVARKHTAQH
jgi:Flp pilus assembly protein TadD